jgi:hypothetical protein
MLISRAAFFIRFFTYVPELCGSTNFISVPVFLEQKNLGSVSVIFKKEEQYKCMNSLYLQVMNQAGIVI